MKVIILAAGRGSRLAHHTDDGPKCLASLDGHSLLSYQLAALRSAGLEEIALVTGWKAERLDAYGLPTFHNSGWQTTNMVGSLLCADPWLASSPTLVAYSDIIYTSADVARLAASTAELAIAYDPSWWNLWSARFDEPLSDAETFAIASTGKLADIGRRPQTRGDVQGQYMGLLKFEPAGWRRFKAALETLSPQEKARIDMTTMLARLIAGNAAIDTVAAEGPWCEVDHPSDLMIAQRIRAGAPHLLKPLAEPAS